MYSSIQLAYKYILFWLSASNGKGHGIHSPFVFDFVTKVLNDKYAYSDFVSIEQRRKELLNDRTLLEINDFGAGSVTGLQKQRRIQQIAQSSLKNARFAGLLYKCVRYFQPQQILELGTSLGISTAYMAMGNKNAKVVTLEGAASVAAIAKQGFQKLGLSSIEVLIGNFDQTLPSYLETSSRPLDFVFIDGNHQYEPTVRYFKQLLPHTHSYSVLIFDDIHWSREMERAWNEICAEETVRLTIDLFFIGMVFFRKEQQEKEHFVIRF